MHIKQLVIKRSKIQIKCTFYYKQRLCQMHFLIYNVAVRWWWMVISKQWKSNPTWRIHREIFFHSFIKWLKGSSIIVVICDSQINSDSGKFRERRAADYLNMKKTLDAKSASLRNITILLTTIYNLMILSRCYYKSSFPWLATKANILKMCSFKNILNIILLRTQ